MSTLRVGTISNAGGTQSTASENVINGSAKAWVNFDGSFASSPFTVANGGIRAAFNVSSVTDNGTGDYTINFTTAMPDANYAVTYGNGRRDGGYAMLGSTQNPTTTQYRLTTWSGFSTLTDGLLVYVSFFR